MTQRLGAWARGGTARVEALVDDPATLAKIADDRTSAARALANEIEALLALAGTPVVQLRGVTTIGGRGAALLERLDGPSLAQAASSLAPPARIALVAEVADAVHLVHEIGWVHGDLKPDHIVWAGTPPTPRLLDLGAATRIGAPMSALATRGYVAPERLEPTAATVALDVYALGCIAYELWAGRLPFAGVGRAGLLAHRDQRVPELPGARGSALAEVVRAALAKRAADRPASAAELGAALRAALAHPITDRAPIAVRPRGLARGTRPPTTRAVGGAAVAPAFLCGRADELAAIDAAIAAGDGALITLLGDGGHGKSALLAAAIASGRARGLAIATVDGARPLAAIVAALDPGPADAIAAAALAFVAGGGLGPAHPLAAAPGAVRGAAARALAARLIAAQLVVVDDAHAADPIVLDACEALLRGGWRGAMVVAARPSLARTRPRWGAGAVTARTIPIGPLGRDDARALVRALLPECATVPLTVIDHLIARAAAVPLVLRELIARLRATGRIERGRDGVVSIATDQLDALADGAILAWAVADELASLPTALVRVAQVLAIAGPLVRADRLAVLDDPALEVTLDAAVAEDRLVAHGVVERDGERMRFRHDLVADAIAGAATVELRGAVHAVVAARAQQLTLAQRAAHTAGAGLPAGALWSVAATAALAGHDYLEAERCATAALAIAPSSEALHARGRARARLGHHGPALDDLRAARGAVDGAAPRAIELWLEEATALDWLARYDEAERCTVTATELAAQASSAPSVLQAALAMARGRAAWRARDLATAVAHLTQALAMAADADADACYETVVATHLMLGWLLPSLGELSAARSHLDRAEALAAARHDQLHLAAVANNRYAVCAAAGDRAAARAALAQFTAAGQALGLDVTEYRGHYNEAVVACWCDDDAVAERHAQAALRFEQGAPQRFARPRASLLLALLALRRGDRDAARAAADRATAALAAGDADGAGVVADRLLHRAVGSALDGALGPVQAQALADAALAAGDAELGFEVLELAARVTARAGDLATAAELTRRARAVPGLPRLLTDPRSDLEVPCTI